MNILHLPRTISHGISPSNRRCPYLFKRINICISIAQHKFFRKTCILKQTLLSIPLSHLSHPLSKSSGNSSLNSNLNHGHEEIEETQQTVDWEEIPIKGRVDNIVYSKCEDDDEWQSIFVLDYKMPGTIDPKEWRNSLRYGSAEWTGEIPQTQGRRSLRIQPWIRKAPIGNALELSQQGHKYASIWDCPIVSFFDFTALAAIQFPPETLSQPPDQDLSALIFLTTAKKRFIQGQLALAMQGLRIRGLLDKGRC